MCRKRPKMPKMALKNIITPLKGISTERAKVIAFDGCAATHHSQRWIVGEHSGASRAACSELKLSTLLCAVVRNVRQLAAPRRTDQRRVLVGGMRRSALRSTLTARRLQRCARCGNVCGISCGKIR